MIDMDILRRLSDSVADFVRAASEDIRNTRPADMLDYDRLVMEGGRIRVIVEFEPAHVATLFLVKGEHATKMGAFPFFTETFSLGDEPIIDE